MNLKIDAASRDEYVYYRLQRALGTLDEADSLADKVITAVLSIFDIEKIQRYFSSQSVVKACLILYR